MTRTRASFVTAHGQVHTFDVEVAQTEDEQRRGLQGRTFLEPDAGMLFDLGAPRSAYFWMRDVPIALDMVFVDARGFVLGVTTASPHDDTPRWSPGPVRYVVELAAGEAKRRGIGARSRLVLPGSAKVRGAALGVVPSQTERPTMHQALLLTLGADVLGNATARAFPTSQIYPVSTVYQTADGTNYWGGAMPPGMGDEENLPPESHLSPPAYNEPPAYYEWPGLAAAEGFPQISSLVLEALPLSGSYAIPVAPAGWGFRRSQMFLADPYIPFPPSLIGA